MAHFAKVVNGTVEQIIVADSEFFNTFTDDSPGEWIQTSYNTYGGTHKLGDTPLRKNYAGVGDIYDPVRDAFYAQKPYPSWTLDEDSCLWYAPVDYPDDSKMYGWNEEAQQWEINS